MPSETFSREYSDVLKTPIKELGLKIEGSPVEAFVLQLYEELEARGLRHFRPACYLTDEWGCPNEEPIIGIPFYLADRRVSAYERSVNDIEDDREIMMYMRHEAGHAFNYAYELYDTEEWRDLFGPFRRAYRDQYRFVPFSRDYVRHLAGWYAQKHPDEDFAETFAVWLTPRSNWKKKYSGWEALRKLQYVDRIAREVADQHPSRPMGEVDISVDDMEATVEEFYRENMLAESEAIQHLALAVDLEDIFESEGPDGETMMAADFLTKHKKQIVDRIAYWTGVQRPLVKKLVDGIHHRLQELDLCVRENEKPARLVEITVYATTLAMNHLTRGKLIRTR